MATQLFGFDYALQPRELGRITGGRYTLTLTGGNEDPPVADLSIALSTITGTLRPTGEQSHIAFSSRDSVSLNEVFSRRNGDLVLGIYDQYENGDFLWSGDLVFPLTNHRFFFGPSSVSFVLISASNVTWAAPRTLVIENTPEHKRYSTVGETTNLEYVFPGVSIAKFQPGDQITHDGDTSIINHITLEYNGRGASVMLSTTVE